MPRLSSRRNSREFRVYFAPAYNSTDSLYLGLLGRIIRISGFALYISFRPVMLAWPRFDSGHHQRLAHSRCGRVDGIQPVNVWFWTSGADVQKRVAARYLGIGSGFSRI